VIPTQSSDAPLERLSVDQLVIIMDALMDMATKCMHVGDWEEERRVWHVHEIITEALGEHHDPSSRVPGDRA
jgi:hypothetical protein